MSDREQFNTPYPHERGDPAQLVKNQCRAACYHLVRAYNALREAEDRYDVDNIAADTAIVEFRRLQECREALQEAMFVFDCMWNEDDIFVRIHSTEPTAAWIECNRKDLRNIVSDQVALYMGKNNFRYSDRDLRRYRALSTGRIAPYAPIWQRFPEAWARSEMTRTAAAAARLGVVHPQPTPAAADTASAKPPPTIQPAPDGKEGKAPPPASPFSKGPHSIALGNMLLRAPPPKASGTHDQPTGLVLTPPLQQQLRHGHRGLYW